MIGRLPPWLEAALTAGGISLTAKKPLVVFPVFLEIAG
jgi:hypothetical protein